MANRVLASLASALALTVLSMPGLSQASATNSWTKSLTGVETDTRAGYPRVILDGSTYKMWVEQNGTGAIRYATSADGITWSALQDTSITGGGNAAHEQTVIKDGSIYKMWFNDIPNTAIGYRTSTDGITWTSAVDVTLNGGGQNWDGDHITPIVIKDGSNYKLYYNADEGNGDYYIAYATSTDGVNWTEPQNLGQVQSDAGNTNNNLVLKQDGTGAWDGYQTGEALYSFSVIKNSAGTYEMWYAGNKAGEAGGADGYKIGYATSTDGIAWTKSASNPVMAGTTGGVDANGVYYPNVIENTSTNLYQMFYWIYNQSWNGNVGYATSPVVTTVSTASTTSIPTLTVTAPNNNITVTSASYTVKGTVSDASATVKIVLNDTDQGSITVASDGSFSKAITLKSGANTVKVTATNSAGTKTVTQTITANILASTGLSYWFAVGILALLGLGVWLAFPKRSRA